jgi:hypothetical protein
VQSRTDERAARRTPGPRDPRRSVHRSPVVELFRKEGAHVTADESDYTDPDAARDVVGRAGRIDVLITNFAGPLRNKNPGPDSQGLYHCRERDQYHGAARLPCCPDYIATDPTELRRGDP